MTGNERETFDEYMRRTASWGVYIENALLRRALSGPDRLKHFHTVKALFFFLEKRDVIIHKHRRGSARYEINYNAEITFSFDEAERRGIPRKYFFRATRDLHAGGYIDIVYIGSGSLKDASRYRLSKRWRKGDDLPIPERRKKKKAKDADEETKLPRDGKGRWIPSGEFSQVGKQPPSRVAKNLLEETPQVANRLLGNDHFAKIKSGQVPTNLKTYQVKKTASDCDDLGGKEEKKGLEGNSGQPRGGGDGILTIFTEALFHLPDDKKQIVIDLRRQVEAGTLPPRHARTKLVMPRILTPEIARLLFPDPPKGGRT